MIGDWLRFRQRPNNEYASEEVYDIRTVVVSRWWCLGGVSVVSRWYLGGILVVSRWCLGGVLVVSRGIR